MNHCKFLVLSTVLLIASHSFAAAEWAERISMKGDFRYRHDYAKEELAGKTESYERHRQRLRLRLGINGQINDSTEMVMRLATGSTTVVDTTTTNQTLDDYYARKGIYLDHMYVNWKASDTVTVWAGKFPNALYYVGGNDLMFDTDLSPEGAAVKYKETFGNIELLANLSSTWLDERYSSTTGDDTDLGLTAGQIAGNYKAESFNMLLGYAYYSYSNLKNATLSDATAAKGNSVTTASGATKYDLDYHIHAFSLELGTTMASTPVVLYTEIISNETGYQYKSGSIAGLKVNKLKEPGSWNFALDRRELEKNAALGVFTDGDCGGGGTNIRGWRTSAQYQWAKNSNIGLTYFNFDKNISDAKTLAFEKVFVDMNFNF